MAYDRESEHNRMLSPTFRGNRDFDHSQDPYDYPCSDTFLGYGEEMGYLKIRGYSQRFNRQELEDISKEIARQGAEIAEMRMMQAIDAPDEELQAPDSIEEPPVSSRTAPNTRIAPTLKRKGTNLNGHSTG